VTRTTPISVRCFRRVRDPGKDVISRVAGMRKVMKVPCDVVFRLPSNRTLFSPIVLVFAIFAYAGNASAQSGDLYIYPSKGQTQAQQDKDRYECHSWPSSKPDSIRANLLPRQVQASPNPTSRRSLMFSKESLAVRPSARSVAQ